MIQVFKDEQNNEYYALLSDFYLKLIFPKYLLNIIKTEYEKKSKSEQVLIEYLNVLENVYLNFKSSVKTED
jgi:predicted nucleic acid-binding protein